MAVKVLGVGILDKETTGLYFEILRMERRTW